MLQGIRILDFSRYIPGPFASVRLADLGAEVIKVEPPGGDPARHVGEMREGTGLIHWANNRNKQSIVLDLKKETGRQLALELIGCCDVVLESFRPGVMDRLGLGYGEAARVRPDIIYCSLTGYGREGPLSRMGSHDLNYMALSGMLAQWKDGEGKPVHPTVTLADLTGGMAACEAILAALIRRMQNGQGSWLTLSLADEMLTLLGTHAAIHGETGGTRGVDWLAGEWIAYGLYETKDGRYVSLAALEPPFWRNFCTALHREDWVEAQFTRKSEENPVYRDLKELFRSRTWEEWLRFGMEVDCCLTPVMEVGEWERHPYFREKGLVGRSPWGVTEVRRKWEGAVSIDGSPSPPPRIGEHTDAVLTRLLGASEEEITGWRRDGVIG